MHRVSYEEMNLPEIFIIHDKVEKISQMHESDLGIGSPSIRRLYPASTGKKSRLRNSALSQILLGSLIGRKLMHIK